MKISAIEPISPAWNKMVHILFKPFDFQKWLVLGFCAFLAQCGESGGSAGSSGNPGGGGNSEPTIPEMKAMVTEHLELIIGIGIGVFVLVILLTILVTWLSSRGKFMFLDGIVKNRGAVQEPWAEYKKEGNSLCIWSILIRFSALIFFVGATALALLIAWPDIESETFGSYAVNALIVGGGSLLILAVIFALLAFYIRIFVIPTMYLRRIPFMQAASVAYTDCVCNHKLPAICLLCMLFVLGIATASIVYAVTCLTCCLAALPYISSVVFLPVSVFFVCYAVFYLQQFGDDWRFFPPECHSCGYSLEALSETTACPECGYDQA
ncbi:MAG: hypothetical protein VX615_03030 [Planctomycetota bacterium]|nr:hypothetical protein [Planctomycetota bacterium]